MKKRLIVPVISALGLLLVIAWMANIFNDRVVPGLESPASNLDGDAIPVLVKKIPIVEPVPGTIVAKQSTEISSRILARIDKILVRAGDNVEQGDLLIQLEQTDLQSRSAQAVEHVNGIEARFKEATQQHERIEALFEQGMIARSEMDKTKASKDSLQAELSQAKQQLNEMQTSLQYSHITAPISGRIIDRYAEPGDTASPGEKLLSLYNPLSLRVEAHVRERLAIGLRVGSELSVEVPSLHRVLSGTIDEIVPAANAGARSFKVDVLMQYSAEMLPGMFARLLFSLAKEERILVPADRIASVGQLDIIWVLTNGGSQKRIVTLGKRHNDLVEVLTGIDRTDMILPILSKSSIPD
jgi:RND family efflux transporter MFP subunit